MRRVLVLAVLLFWQGGFTFYSAVVIHVGRDVLGSHRDQGFITRRVTDYLNLAGAVALPILAWELVASREPSRGRRRARWATWAGLALTLALLAWMPSWIRVISPSAIVGSSVSGTVGTCTPARSNGPAPWSTAC